VCSDVGELIICDRPGCIYSFHLKCVGLDNVPDGDWICNYCSANPIDPNDGHHVYCVECGKPGNLIMCDVRDCPRSYHFSCVGLSDDLLPGQLSRVSHFQSSLTAAPAYPLPYFFRRLVLPMPSIRAPCEHHPPHSVVGA